MSAEQKSQRLEDLTAELAAEGKANGGGAPSVLRESSGQGMDFSPISLEAAAGVVAGVRRATQKRWDLDLHLAPTFDALPDEVKKDVQRNYGQDARPRGVTFGEAVYLVADEHGSEAELEATILHEVKGHVGVRRFYGADIVRDLNQLFLQIGGNAGIKKLANDRNIAELGQYAQKLSKSPMSDEDRVRVMMEEVLAHIAEEPRFMDRVKALIGKVREMLRATGWVKLARLGETDLLHILKQAEGKLSQRPDPTGPKGGKPAPAAPKLGEDARASITETEAFKKWFGGSRVVDAEGKPLRVYHGTGADFDAFQENERGIFFAEDPAVAAPFSRIRKGEPRTIPAYLAISNPWTMIRYSDSTPYSQMADQTVATLKANGYDGIHAPDDGVWIAFFPEQIKSAIGNNGQFDPANPSIMASRKTPPIDKANQRTALFTALAKSDDAFQQPTPTGKTVEAIAREIDPEYSAKPMPANQVKMRGKGRAVRAWEISVPKSDVRSGYLYEDARGRVWIDVSRLQPGIDTGNVIYGIAAGYAHNTGKVFIGDPEGLSPTALFRRLENMISSALRFGTTDHLYPHGAQIDPVGYFTDQYPDFAPQTRGLGIDWKDGDFSHNLTEMLRASYNAGIRFAPEIKEIVYDFDSRQFVDAVTGERRDRSDFAGISERLRGGSSSRYRGGSSTLARTALVNTLLRGEGKEAWGRVVAAVGDQLRGRGLDAELRGIFYRRNDATPGTTNNPSGLTADQFRAALVERFGEDGVASLERQGLLNIGASNDEGMSAWYDTTDGSAHFDPSQMASGEDAVAAVLHEVGEHHGLRAMLGDRGWRALKSRIAALATQPGEVAAAWRGVVANYTKFADYAKDFDAAAKDDEFIHEVIAKIGETAAGRKSSLWREILAEINRFLLKMGMGRPINKNELADLVEGSLKRVMGYRNTAKSPEWLSDNGLQLPNSLSAALALGEVSCQAADEVNGSADSPSRRWRSQLLCSGPGYRSAEVFALL